MPTRRARPAPPPPPSRGAAIAVRESGAGAGDARAAESDEDPFMASLPATVHAANKEGRAKLVQEIHTHAKAHGKSMRTAAKIEGVGFSGSRTALMACSSSECSCVVTLRCRKEGWRVDLCSCRPHNRLCVSTARTNKARDIAAVSSVQLTLIGTKEQLADIFTKQLSHKDHENMKNRLMDGDLNNVMTT